MSNTHASAFDIPVEARLSNRYMNRLIWSSVLGSTVEWYDFLIYGLAVALVFNQLFFPAFDPLVGTLAAFGSYAVGFIARPMGGLVFGHFGDKLGRKAMLTLTMLIMGVGTFLIGCLPTYASIGIWAPVILILLRFCQGIGIGGEWGGAVLMVIENSPARKRGYYGSLVQLGFPLGVISSTVVFVLLTKMPEADFMSWGWRVPFLLSAVLIGVGIFVRLQLEETPVFKRAKREDKIVEAPLLEAIRKNPRPFLVSVGLKVCEIGWISLITSFGVMYGTKYLGLSKVTILNGIAMAAMFELLAIPLFGKLSDRLGRKPLCIAATLFSALLAYPIFWALQSGDTMTMLVALTAVMVLVHALIFSVEAAFMAELFATEVRYSGASMGFQISAAISGGFAPILATYLLGNFHATWPISLMLVVLSAISLVALLCAPETSRVDLGSN